MILEKTVELINQIYKVHRIIPPKPDRIVLGLGYSGVELSTFSHGTFLGVAYTLPDLVRSKACGKLQNSGSLTDLKLQELLKWAYSPPSLQKIIGVATLNAFSQYILKVINPYEKMKEDLIDSLHLNEESKIFFIGMIKPMIRRIGKITKNITIIENRIPNSPEFEKFAFKTSIEQLNGMDLRTDALFITGTALLNNTIDAILEKFKHKAKKIMLIGPTASMIPDILFDRGVDVVAGMYMKEPDAVVRIIQEGGGTMNFKKFGKKYSLVRSP